MMSHRCQLLIAEHAQDLLTGRWPVREKELATISSSAVGGSLRLKWFPERSTTFFKKTYMGEEKGNSAVRLVVIDDLAIPTSKTEDSRGKLKSGTALRALLQAKDAYLFLPGFISGVVNSVGCVVLLRCVACAHRVIR
jgi:hypothetical protein